MHVCWYLGWIHRSFQLCSILNVEQLINFKDVVQFLLNMCLYDVCTLILTKPHANQKWVSNQEKWSNNTRIPSTCRCLGSPDATFLLVHRSSTTEPCGQLPGPPTLASITTTYYPAQPPHKKGERQGEKRNPHTLGPTVHSTQPRYTKPFKLPSFPNCPIVSPSPATGVVVWWACFPSLLTVAHLTIVIPSSTQ